MAQDIYSSLLLSYEESLEEAKELALSTMMDIYTPLLPPILGKQDIITALHRYKRVYSKIENKISFLTLITDYVVAAIISPFLDLFQQDTFDRSKQHMLDLLAKEWVVLFQSILASFPLYKPKMEVMKATLSFLQRMNDHLDSSNARITSPFCSSVSQQCFWSFDLQSIDKKEAPLQSTKTISRQNLCVGQEPVSFGPTDEDFGAIARIPSREEATESPSTTITQLDLIVKRLHVASLQLKNGVEQQITCTVEEKGIVLIITTRSGEYCKMVLGTRDVSAIALSLVGDQMMFMFLSLPGCVAVQNRLSCLPDMSVPPLALLGDQNRRLVFFLKNIGTSEFAVLKNFLVTVVGEKLCCVKQADGKKLFNKKIDYEKLIPDLSKKHRRDVVERYGDRGNMSSGWKEGDKLSLVNKYEAGRGEIKEGNYWADPGELLCAQQAGEQQQQVNTKQSGGQNTTKERVGQAIPKVRGSKGSITKTSNGQFINQKLSKHISNKMRNDSRQVITEDTGGQVLIRQKPEQSYRRLGGAEYSNKPSGGQTHSKSRGIGNLFLSNPLVQTHGQITIKQTPGQLIVKQTPEQITTKQTPGQNTTKQTPEQITTKQTPGQITSKQTPGQITTKQTPGQTTTKQAPGQTTTKQTPGQITIKQTSGQITAKLTPGQITSKQTPGQITTKQTPVHGSQDYDTHWQTSKNHKVGNYKTPKVVSSATELAARVLDPQEKTVNAFVLFSANLWKSMEEKNPRSLEDEIIKVISEKWALLSDIDKQMLEDRAKKINEDERLEDTREEILRIARCIKSILVPSGSRPKTSHSHCDRVGDQVAWPDDERRSADEKNSLPRDEEIKEVHIKKRNQLSDFEMIEERVIEINEDEGEVGLIDKTMQTNKENILTVHKSSSVPKTKAAQDKSKCRPFTEDSPCKVYQLTPAKTSCHPGDSRTVLDIPVILASTKQEFFQLNLANIKTKIPGKDTLQLKYLEIKWQELNLALNKRKVEEDTNEANDQAVKRGRINIVKHLAQHPTEDNGALVANIQSSDCADAVTLPGVVTTTNVKGPSEILPTEHPEVLAMSSNQPDLSRPVSSKFVQSSSQRLSATSSPKPERPKSIPTTTTSKCKCDDCMYVTKSHMERFKDNTWCKCHPCVLRRSQVTDNVAKPWDLVPLNEYEGENYWLEPWLLDLFKQIKAKHHSVTEVASMTGTYYSKVYYHYKEWLTNQRSEVTDNVAKPWDLVPLNEYEGENYWLEPWLEDLFKQIKANNHSVTEVANMTGTYYSKVYYHYKEWLTNQNV